jgi:cation diffusion facilitator CzcD-associated flavoprotein CzcO
MIFGTGYYNYKEPLQVEIPGLDNFEGQVIHPQFWPEELDYEGKKVIVIGSGATAITLVPSMAEKAARVTMLQRSPTYIMTLPNRKNVLSYLLPSSFSNWMNRLIWIYTGRLFFLFCKRFPSWSRWLLMLGMRKQLPTHISDDPHFRPRYNPWDQRLCVCPDGDFFKSLQSGKADVKTGTIQTVTKSGIALNSGETIDADIIVTATGLKLQFAGGTLLSVDGQKFDMASKFVWNGMMLQDLPNAAFVFGYTNASWTLGADATAQFVCRLLKTLEERGCVAVVPRVEPHVAATLERRPLLNLNSTYITTALDELPMVADRGPWQPRDHYMKDMKFAKKGDLNSGMEFVESPIQH